MTNPVAINAADPAPALKATDAVSPAAPAPQRSDSAPNPAQSDLRLVIEEDQASGQFVYKTVDRRTGEVVQQLPREQLLKLRDNLEYLPGMVLDARS